ncbi:MarR family winged helix-turn-helix transcriptional regulator [Chitinophaga sp. Cy-1792]|uniref:MarR family winged helix-turn-helix transcriptional regulator n=1 Tax=Chitinophaga sp. Cy-1792 TaxID=2608339 RepID=UPI001421B40D|nr:MarR family transcriptional regulator [Chitinophaga sp. Cy-1792]NIG57494.1 MarR family transcriptional regulator [Chitinophaga sp. Cy-1792]
MVTKKDQEIAMGIRQLVSVLRKRLRKQISNPEDLSMAELNVLSMLMTRKELLPSELGSQLKISSQFMSQVLKRLQELDYISRKTAAEDKRKSLISITRTGQQMVEQTRKERDEWLAKKIATLYSAQEKETIKSALSLLTALEDEQ